MPVPNLDQLAALDFHVHVERSASTPRRLDASTSPTSMAGFGISGLDVHQIAVRYRDNDMACVVFPLDLELVTGTPPVPNEEIAEAAVAYPETLIPFASIDPHRGAAGAKEMRRLIEQYGVRGLKLHPSLQEFFPNDPACYRLYEVLEELGAVALFHTGQTPSHAGRGVRLKYSNPMCLDDVAVDFPQLRIVMAHPSVPWQDEAIAVAQMKEHVYIDLSGWSPRHFPAQLVHHANRLLKHKVLFGSDFPFITPERWLGDFAGIDIRAEVRPLILKQNAARLLFEGAAQ